MLIVGRFLINSKTIVDGRIVTRDSLLERGSVLIEGNRITACGRADEIRLPERTEMVSAEGLIVGPGLIDIHCCGNLEISYEEAVAFHVKHGTTGILQVFNSTIDEAQFRREANKIREAGTSEFGSSIIGLYLEGPPTNQNYGAKSPETGSTVFQNYRRMLDIAGDLIDGNHSWCGAFGSPGRAGPGARAAGIAFGHTLHERHGVPKTRRNPGGRCR